jgi:hypothetical protein
MRKMKFETRNGAIEDGHGVPCPYGRAVLASGIGRERGFE